MSPEQQNQDWAEWKQMILFQLKEQGKDIKEIETTLLNIQKDLVVLKVKAGIFGAAASLLVGVLWKFVTEF